MPPAVERSVSRETSSLPAGAQELFGASLPTALRYADLLATDGVVRGLIGPREADRLWERHLLNCAALAPALDHGTEVVDVGSGAGLPGLVLAIARPDVRVTLVEPLERRIGFLGEAVESLGLANVTVRRMRAEALEPGRADVVTARAVAPLEKLVRWCLPALRPGGRLLAMKGARAAVELAETEPLLRRLRVPTWRIVQMGLDVLEQPATVVEIVRGPVRGGARDSPR
jgi:16S rRNA (guanine527-N7)-methyltransferase